MVQKYVRALKEMEICEKTGEVWTINDVPKLWRNKVKKQLEDEGYEFDEEGHAILPEPEVTEEDAPESDIVEEESKEE